MAIFGRRTARQRLRKATQESLTIPAFSAPPDCTPWVIGGLWPAELSPSTAETATLAEYLKIDLQRIASSANDELMNIRRATMVDSGGRAAEARVIDEARALAVRRVESTLRQLREVAQDAAPAYPRPQVAGGLAVTDVDRTQLLPAIRDGQPEEPEETPAARLPDEEVDEATTRREAEAVTETESDDERIHRLLAFVARQEPRLNWAVGNRADGTTVLVTDLAHGWIPPGITLPEGVRLLEPARRTGTVAALIGTTTRSATYTPGDSLTWTADVTATKSSVQPRELPAVEDLGWEVGDATRSRDGVPRMVHALARAAASGTGVAEEEVDLLRVHLDTARYQVLVQYPDVDPALLLNCMLLAAIEGSVTGDAVAANYHLAWFRKLDKSPVSECAANL